MIQVMSSSRYRINKKYLKNEASKYFGEYGFATNHLINIVFVGKKKMKEVAAKYKEEDVALPVLSFLYNEEADGKKLLGEVMICYPQAVLMAAQKEKKVDDVVVSLIKHGIDNIVKNLS